ncbi:DUF3472 domain-containing protein [Mucilaginibacter sp. 14171R-50]|uniref:DUF3472 domain-containing protein n=1 Tax=Mucilaginibacter sp. 14171R-50 TaxID=2703789 RepID=UPI00138B7076|nr:DUF3472 domain-containing protein [Mucilaginibacter sp. 14171R-50]QHS54794.1 DUF3472 domain-containing protein [Mucilaginibacter sp. 14171R-50]
MKKISLFLYIAVAVAISANAQSTKAIIPLGGNAWATGSAVITDAGLTNWKSPHDVTSIYLRVSAAQKLSLALMLRVPAGKSKISISIGKNTVIKQINNTVFDTLNIGDVMVKPGYLKIDLKGVSKTGDVYADVADLLVNNINPENELTYVKTGTSFHFGRRGPSVHLRYNIPPELKKDVKWFYNEITVPRKMDVIGSYFMADGFNGGYFGMQVNSATERRILFSVWSPFNTDDPKSIPDSLKIKLLKKGKAVHGGEFGDEGSGGQSYMNYPWVAGQTYGFLLGAEPDSLHNTTTYTAWFKEVSTGNWQLIASFARPKTNSYLSGLYSFVENFEPDNGDKVRMALFTGHWLADSNGKWHQSPGATYTGDETARKNYRKDYAGGLKDGKLYLRNGGFFDDLVPLNQHFMPATTTPQPIIDFKSLPR